VFGVVERREAQQRADRREACVARAGAVAPLALDVLEEGTDQWRVEVVELQLTGLLAGLLLREGQQQSPRAR